MPDAPPPNDALEKALAATLDDALGPATITGLARVSAGANRETWSFDAATDTATHELIMQRDRAGMDRLIGACAREARVLRAAAAAGAPVAEVVVSGEAGGVLDRSFTINRRLQGETIARKILRDDAWERARAGFVGDCAKALATIHSVTPSEMADVDIVDVPDELDAQVTIYDAIDDPHPAFDLAIRWLEQNRPSTVGHTLVHGDFRLGNLLLGADGLLAALDWELAHFGDPAQDLGWLCVPAWRFGGAGPVGGIGDYEVLLDAYAQAGGRPVPMATLRWWEIFGTLRWGVICLQMGGDFRAGRTPSIEMATIGRRVAENEHDLMNLLRQEIS